jgi:hypothetical protein
VEVHVVPRGDRGTIQRGGLVVPPPQSSLDLFINAVADCLDNFRLDHIALRVDRHFNHHIAHQIAWQAGTVYRRVRVNSRICDVDFVAGNRAINHCPKRRPGMGVPVAGIRVGYNGLWFRGGFWRLSFRKRARPRLACTRWKKQLARVRRNLTRAWREIDQLCRMTAVAIGKPGGREFDNLRNVKHNHC